MRLRRTRNRLKRNPGDDSKNVFSDSGDVKQNAIALAVESDGPGFNLQSMGETIQVLTTQPAVVVSLQNTLQTQPLTTPQLTNTRPTIAVASVLAGQTAILATTTSLVTISTASVMSIPTTIIVSARTSVLSTLSTVLPTTSNLHESAPVSNIATKTSSSTTSANATLASGASLASSSEHAHTATFYVGIAFGAIAGFACVVAFISWFIRSCRRSSGTCSNDEYTDLEYHNGGSKALPTMFERVVPRHSDGTTTSRVEPMLHASQGLSTTASNAFVIPPPKPFSPLHGNTPRRPKDYSVPNTSEYNRSPTPTPIDLSLGKLTVQNLMPGDISSAEESCVPKLRRDLSALGFIDSDAKKSGAVSRATARPNDSGLTDQGSETPLAQALVQAAVAVASTPPPLCSVITPRFPASGDTGIKYSSSPWMPGAIFDTASRTYHVSTPSNSHSKDLVSLPLSDRRTDKAPTLPTPQFTHFSQLRIGTSSGNIAGGDLNLSSKNPSLGSDIPVSTESEGWGAALRSSIMSKLSAMTGTAQIAQSAMQERDIYTSLPSRSSTLEIGLAPGPNLQSQSESGINMIARREMGLVDMDRGAHEQWKSSTVPLNIRKRNTIDAGHAPTRAGLTRIQPVQQCALDSKEADPTRIEVALPHFSTLHPNITVRRRLRPRNVSAPLAKSTRRKGANSTRANPRRHASSSDTGPLSTSFTSEASDSELTEGGVTAKKVLAMRHTRVKHKGMNLDVHTNGDGAAKVKETVKDPGFDMPAQPGTPSRKMLRKQVDISGR